METGDNAFIEMVIHMLLPVSLLTLGSQGRYAWLKKTSRQATLCNVSTDLTLRGREF